MIENNSLIPELRFPEFWDDVEWEVKQLEQVLNFQTGYPFDSEGFNEDGKGIRLIKNRDLKSDDKIVFYRKSYDKKYEVKDGDILVGMDGDFTPIKWSKGRALLNQRVGRVLAHKNGDELFFLYFLSIHLKTIEEKTPRTTVKHLSHSVVEKINEPIPKPKERQKIATCLSSLDEVITAHIQKLEVLKDHKKALMQNLFPQEGETVPKWRFKEFEKNWEKVKLKDVSTYFNGGSYENDVKEEGKYELITLKSIDTSGKLVNSKRYIDIEVPTLTKGTLIMILSEQAPGLLGMTAIIPTEKKYVLNQRIAEIRPNQKVESFFLSMAINRNQVYFSKQGAGMKVQNITKPNVENYEFLIPEIPEQQKIASCLSSLDALISEQAEKIEQLKLHKTGLMQGLFPKIEISL